MKASCPSDIVLSVTYCGDPRHYDISSNYRELKGEHEDCYVSFSGYFGPYRPETFAAAPDLLEALDLARKYMKLCLGSSFWDGPNPYPIIDAASPRREVKSMRELLEDIASFVAVSGFTTVFLFWANQIPGVFK